MKDIGILFDLDGTLLDTLEDLKDATNHVMRSFGFPERSLEEVRRFVGNGAKRLIVQAVPENATPEQAEKAFQAFQSYYRAHCQIKTKPYDGIPEALEALKAAGYPMAIVSNKPDGAVKPLCAQYFPGLYAQGETADCPRKPAPDMVFRAMEAIGVEKCIYVGDSEVDVLTAKNGGMECLSVLWGSRNEGELKENGAKHFCTKPSEIPKKVRELEEIIHGK